VLAVVSMGGFLFSHTLSIDDELTLFAPADGWLGWFSQGRFLIGVMQLLVPQPVTPLFPYLLLACSYVVSYTLILAIHRLRHSWRTHLGFLLFILFPTNWLSQEFAINVPGFALGLLAVCLAAWITQTRNTDSTGWRLGSGAAAVIALLIAAIGGFQSLITLYLAIGSGSLLFDLIGQYRVPPKHSGVQAVARSLLPWFANAAVAVLLHTVLFKLYLNLSGSAVHQIDRYFRSPYFMLRTEPIAYLSGNLHQFLQTYLSPGVFYGNSLWGFSALLLGFPLIVLLGRPSAPSDQPPANGGLLRASEPALLTLVALGLLVVLLPLSLNIISKPYRIPMRALMALPYVAWLASMLWLQSKGLARERARLLIGGTLSVILVAQCLICSSHYYAARSFNFRNDQLLAATLASAISQAPAEGNPGVSRFLSQGALKRKVPYNVAMYSTAGSSFFNWDNGNNGRMVAWLKAMGIQSLEPVDAEQAADFSADLARMRPWPSPGSIRVKGDTLLLKLDE